MPNTQSFIRSSRAPGKKLRRPKSRHLPIDFKWPDKLMWLRFIGITGIQSILIEGTLHGPDKMKAAKAAGAGKAREITRSF